MTSDLCSQEELVEIVATMGELVLISDNPAEELLLQMFLLGIEFDAEAGSVLAEIWAEWAAANLGPVILDQVREILAKEFPGAR